MSPRKAPTVQNVKKEKYVSNNTNGRHYKNTKGNTTILLRSKYLNNVKV